MNKANTVHIFTFCLSYNVGAVLQAYALKQAITQLGYAVNFVNVLPHEIYQLCFDWTQPGSKKLKDSFNEFRELHLSPITELLDSNGNIISFKDTDILLVGSDQIWNVKYSKEYYLHFFLDFATRRNIKIAYAASIGGKEIIIDEPSLDEIGKLLEKFNAISCREKEGTHYLKEQFSINAIQVLDPTLLPGIDYSPLFPMQSIQTGDELVYSAITPDRWLKYDWIRYMSKLLELPARVVNNKPTEKDFSYSHYVGIDEWLRIMYNASFVVTDSYHAVIFSILFKKPFIVVPCIIGGVYHNEQKSRFDTLLTDLGLMDRYFSSFEEIQSDHRWKSPIDYQKVYVHLAKLREYSIHFLENSLKNIKHV